MIPQQGPPSETLTRCGGNLEGWEPGGSRWPGGPSLGSPLTRGIALPGPHPPKNPQNSPNQTASLPQPAAW